MNIIETSLPGVFVIEPKVFGDERGYFFEMYNSKQYATACPVKAFVQDNVSRSVKGVLRGLHYQLNHPQGKLVCVLRGAVLDVVVDIRRGSPTFKQWIGIELNESNHRQVYIPPGFAHGFQVLSDEAYFHYKCTDYYHPEDEHGIKWNDPELNIAWQLTSEPTISAKDILHPTLAQADFDKLPLYAANEKVLLAP
jgi:dTDP-4-dehydrorhamnose 3,5-epimerase